MSLCTVTMTADSLGTLWDKVVFCLAPIMFGLLWSLSVPSGETGRVPTSGQIPGKENIVDTAMGVGGQGGLINHLVNPCSWFSARRAALLSIYGCGLSVIHQVKGYDL